MDSEDASSIPIEQDQQRLLHGRILALFLRMMLPTNNKDKDGSTKAMLGLTKTLLCIICCCYSIETKTTININTRCVKNYFSCGFSFHSSNFKLGFLM